MSRTYIIAEAGSNHEGNFNKALKLIKHAGLAGADAIKFQAFRSGMIESREEIQENLREFELPLHWVPELKSYAESNGLDFLCTPFDEPLVDFLDGQGIKAFKIASGDLTNHSLIRAVAKTRKQVFLSVGGGTLIEIHSALRILEKNNPVVLHCVPLYPCPIDKVGLSSIRELENELLVPIGFSDHSTSTLIPSIAVGMGARVIEKHFRLYTYMQKGTSPDFPHSLDPYGFALMVDGIREAEMALPNGVFSGDIRAIRRGLYYKRPLKKGHRIQEGDLVALRPEGPISASENLEGKILSRDVSGGPCRWEDFE